MLVISVRNFSSEIVQSWQGVIHTYIYIYIYIEPDKAWGLRAGCDFFRQLLDHEVFWRPAAGRHFYSARDLLWRLPWSLSGCFGGPWGDFDLPIRCCFLSLLCSCTKL